MNTTYTVFSNICYFRNKVKQHQFNFISMTIFVIQMKALQTLFNKLRLIFGKNGFYAIATNAVSIAFLIGNEVIEALLLRKACYVLYASYLAISVYIPK